MKNMKKILAALFVVSSAFMLSGCDDNEMQEPGDQLEEAADQTGEAVDEAADETGEAVDEAADETEDVFQ